MDASQIGEYAERILDTIRTANMDSIDKMMLLALLVNGVSCENTNNDKNSSSIYIRNLITAIEGLRECEFEWINKGLDKNEVG